MVIHRWRVPVIVFLLLGLFTTSWSLSAAAAGEASAGVPQLTLLKTIPIGGSDGWDYLCADSTARRLYLPRSTHVQVLDLDTGTVLGDIAITGTKNLHGVALALEQGLGFTTGGRDNNAVSVFDLKTFQVAKTIKAGRSPDSILYDPASKHILSIKHDSGDVTVIDPAALDVAMSANGIDGTMSVVKETSTGSFEAVQTPKTIKGCADRHDGFEKAPGSAALQHT